MAEGDRMFTVL